jgi:hypothetical protein
MHSLSSYRAALYLLIACVIFYATSATTAEDEFQLLYPENSVSSKPILEFRSRELDIKNKAMTHAFVVLGRELDNGTTVFYGAAGFYPAGADNKLQSFKNVLNSPGHVDYKIADMQSTEAFRVRITGEQENAVRFLINSWNAGDYKFFEQNCTSLIRSVGRMLGLDTGFPGATEMTPGQLIRHMKLENDPDKPLRHALAEWQRAAAKIQAQRGQMSEVIGRMVKRAQEVARSQAEWAQWQQLHANWSSEFYNTVKPTTTIRPENNLFPADSPLSAYWPWPPPSPLKSDVATPPLQPGVKVPPQP